MEPAGAQTAEAPADPEFEFAVVEIFGRRRHAGRVREEERFGAKMLRIDVPTIEWSDPPDGEKPAAVITGWVTHWYGGGSVFSMTLTDEASVLRINRPYAPAQRYIAPPDEDDDDQDGDEGPYDDDF